MGARETIRRRGRSARGALATVGAASLILLGAGCGSDTETTETTAPPGPRSGPASPEGDIDQSAATLRKGDGFSTLVETQVTTRGSDATLIVGQVQLQPGSNEPRLRLQVDGKTQGGTQVDITSSEGRKVAVISCACKLSSDVHVVVVEGSAPSDGTAKVGVRTIAAFPEIELNQSNANPVIISALNTDTVQVDAEGATLLQTDATADTGSGPAIVIGALRAPRSGVGSENVRTELQIDDTPPDELAKTTIPSGKLVAFYAGDGISANDSIELRGFTTSGETPVSVSALIVCPCSLAGAG